MIENNNNEILKHINITGELSQEECAKNFWFIPVKDLDKNLFHFVTISEKTYGYVYRIKNEHIECFDTFNNWRITINSMQFFKTNKFVKINFNPTTNTPNIMSEKTEEKTEILLDKDFVRQLEKIPFEIKCNINFNHITELEKENIDNLILLDKKS